MKQFDLAGNCGKLVLKDNVLAVLSDVDLSTVSSAIYNGGFKKVKAILNVQVPEEYSDRRLHENPQSFIMDSAKKLGLAESFVGMVTAAAIDKFSLVSKKDGDVAVSVIATAVDPAGTGSGSIRHHTGSPPLINASRCASASSAKWMLAG